MPLEIQLKSNKKHKKQLLSVVKELVNNDESLDTFFYLLSDKGLATLALLSSDRELLSFIKKEQEHRKKLEEFKSES